MTKYRIAVVVLLVIMVVVCIFCNDYLIFLVHRHEANRYIRSHYQFEYTICKETVGHSRYPESRENDQFVVHDQTNNIYFTIKVGVDGVVDEYRAAKSGVQIADRIVERHNNTSMNANKILVRAWGNPEDHADMYQSPRIQLAWFEHSETVNYTQLYSLILNVFEDTPDALVRLMVFPEESWERCRAVMNYSSDEAFGDLPYYCMCELSSLAKSVSSLSEFADYLESQIGN